MADEERDNTQDPGAAAEPEGAADAQAADAGAGSDAASGEVGGTELGGAEASVNEALSDAEQSLQALQEAVDAGEGGSLDPSDIALLGDVELNVTIELGRTEMLVEDVLKVGSGSVIELDKLAGDPVDVHVNGRLVARGEVLVLNDNFCIRISEIVADLQEQAQAAVSEREPVRRVGAAEAGAAEAAPASSAGESEAAEEA